jgi:hypothetical protein
MKPTSKYSQRNRLFNISRVFQNKGTKFGHLEEISGNMSNASANQ